jgi:hypothetical protein
MSSRDEHTTTPFPKPIEIKLADVLFFAMRKNLILFKDLGKQHIHYSFFIHGSTIDCHQTLEVDHKHIPLLKLEFDWQLLLQRVMKEVRANWRAIFQIVKIDDPEWMDLEVEFIPVQVLMELLSPIAKGMRWNVDQEFLSKLEQSVSHARLRELAQHGVIIGSGSGYFVLSNGTDCILFDIDRLSEIIENSFELSITKIHLKHYTLRSALWYVKMRLLKLTHSAISICRKRFLEHERRRTA